MKGTECIKPLKKEKTAASGKPSIEVLHQPCLSVVCFPVECSASQLSYSNYGHMTSFLNFFLNRLKAHFSFSTQTTLMVPADMINHSL